MFLQVERRFCFGPPVKTTTQDITHHTSICCVVETQPNITVKIHTQAIKLFYLSMKFIIRISKKKVDVHKLSPTERWSDYTTLEWTCVHVQVSGHLGTYLTGSSRVKGLCVGGYVGQPMVTWTFKKITLQNEPTQKRTCKHPQWMWSSHPPRWLGPAAPTLQPTPEHFHLKHTSTVSHNNSQTCSNTTPATE